MKTPETLTGTAKAWWQRMVAIYDFAEEPEAAAILESAAVQLERIAAYRAAIAKDGLIVRDRFKQPKEHPAAVGERAAANLFRLLIRELGIERSEEEVRLPRLQERTA